MNVRRLWYLRSDLLLFLDEKFNKKADRQTQTTVGWSLKGRVGVRRWKRVEGGQIHSD